MIFISSAAAYIGSRDIGYSISAINGLIHGICKNLKGKNIYVYGIAPGIVETKMSDNMNFNRQNDTILLTQNGRKCDSKEVATLVGFLMMEETNYMSGSIIHINNGLYNN